jgi:signal transduction histidine kinase/PAS domain-containing protein
MSRKQTAMSTMLTHRQMQANAPETDIGIFGDQLAFRIGLRIFVVAVALVALAAGCAAYFGKKLQIENRTAFVENYTSAVAPALARAIWNLDKSNLQQLADSAIAVPGIVGARVADETTLSGPNSASVSSGAIPTVGVAAAASVNVPLFVELADQPPRRVGTLFLFLDEARIDLLIKRQVELVVVGFTLAMALVAIAAFLLIYLDVTRPIRRMARAVSALHPDASEIDAETMGVLAKLQARKDSIGVVAAALGSFVVRLTDRVTSISQLNDTLETVIMERSRALQRTQTLLEAALDAMDAAVSVYAEDGTLFQWNEKFVEYYPGIMPLITAGTSRTAIAQAMEAAGYLGTTEDTGSSLGAGIRMHELGDGRRIRTSVSPIPSGGFVCVSVDLTQIQKALEQAEITAQLLKEVFAAQRAVYMYFDESETLQHWDSTLAGTVLESGGVLDPVSAGFRVGMPWRECVAEIRRGSPPETATRTDAASEPSWYADTRLESRIGRWERERADGTFFRTTVSRTKAGGYIVFTLDLSELQDSRREAERARARAEQQAHQLISIIQQLPVPVTINDVRSNRRLFANDGYLAVVGATDAHPIDSIPPGATWANAADLKRIYADVANGAVIRNVQVARRRIDGSEWICLMSAIPVLYEEATATLFVHNDISSLKEAQDRLETERRLLRVTLDALESGVFLVDNELRIRSLNNALFKVLAIEDGYFKPGDTFADIARYQAKRGEYGPGDVEEQVAARVALANKREAHRFQRSTSDGRVIEVAGKPVEGYGFISIFTDITQLKRQEERLLQLSAESEQARHRAEENETVLKEAVQALGAVDSVWLPDGKLRRYSGHVEALYPGAVSHVVPGVPFPDYLDAIGKAGFKEIAELSTRRDGRTFAELRAIEDVVGIWDRALPDGRFLRTTGTRLSTGGFAIITIDLTALEQARRSALRAEGTLREIVELLDAGFSTYATDETLLVWGDEKSISADDFRFEKGLPYREVLAALRAHGTPEIPDKADRKRPHGYLDYAPLSERLGAWDRHLADGRYVRTVVTRLRDSTYAVVSQDLTTLNEAKESLAKNERMASLGALVAGVAHEVNTPVGIAMTAVTMLSEEIAAVGKQFAAKQLTSQSFEAFLARSGEVSAMIERNVRRAAELIRNFKNVSVDQTSDTRRRFELKSYIAEVLSSLSPTMHRTPHRVGVGGDTDVVLDSYPGAVAQIVTNLTMNGLLHAFPEDAKPGRMAFKVRQIGDTAVLVYKDDGAGMPRETLKRIFDPFFTTKRGSGGTGLGMTIVYNLVTQRLGGTISAKSAPGEGLRIRMTLPTTAPAAAARADEM